MKSISFNDMFFRTLIDKHGFYMKQYKSNFHNVDKFVAMKEVEGGTYCVLITDDVDENIDVSEAIEFLNTIGKKFSLNVLILSTENYISNSLYHFNKLIINRNDNKVIFCDESCLSLQNIFNSIVKNKKEDRFVLKEQLPTIILILINTVIFLITAFFSRSIIDINTYVLLVFGAKFGPFISEGEYYRLFTCAFLHGGLIHLLCNMYSLYILGPQINAVYGTYKYISLYIICCFTSSLMSLICAPNTISVGASGAIFGLMGALIAFAFIERKRIDKRFMSGLLQVLVLNLIIGMSIRNIDNYGHIGGLLGGLIVGYIFYAMRLRSKKGRK